VPTEKNPGRTLLEKHLADYTARNSFDYFIHKEIGGFLRRELDFFIKNEIMHLDDIEDEQAPRVEQYLAKVKAIRAIARKIISFLEQLENFQKKVWLKKKFVVETNYCITLERVPESLYQEIASSDAQRAEWVRLFAIDEIKADLAKPGYSVPLKLEFLSANPFLVLDTKFFTREFKDKLLSDTKTLGGAATLDEATDGLLLNSENFQALQLLQTRYRQHVRAIYIDPPYNTDASAILYKNDYKHSSWISLVACRCAIARQFLPEEGIQCVAIDDIEFHLLRSLLGDLFGEENFLGVAAVRANPAGRSTPTGFSVAHDYAIFVGRTPAASVGRLQRSEKQLARYDESDGKGAFEWVNFRKHGGVAATRSARPRMYFPIYTSEGHIRIPKMEWNEAKKEWIVLEQPLPDEETVWPVGFDGDQKRWKWGMESVVKSTSDFCSRPDQNGRTGVYFKSRMNEEGTLPLTWWDKKEYSATEYGTNLLTDLFGKVGTFSFPKAIHLVEDCLRVCSLEDDGTVLDFFGGSGTTGHAVINLNREDGGKRKYILVEMGIISTQ
jgi:adenine-specific DNA-methyltransferase